MSLHPVGLTRRIVERKDADERVEEILSSSDKPGTLARNSFQRRKSAALEFQDTVIGIYAGIVQ